MSSPSPCLLSQNDVVVFNFCLGRPHQERVNLNPPAEASTSSAQGN